MKQLLLEGVLVFCLLPASAFFPLTTTTNHQQGSLHYLQQLDANTIPGFRIDNRNRQGSSACYMARATNTKKRKRGRRSTKWDTMLPRLEEFHRAHGHSLVTEDDKDFDLYEWTRQLRYSFVHQIRNSTSTVGRSYRRTLSAEQLKQLERLDFVWESKRKRRKPKVGSWDSMIRRLKRYQKVHGHTKVTNEDDSKLHNWCKYVQYTYGHQISNTTSLKVNRRRPRLTSAKLKQLQEIGFQWGKVRRWDMMFPKLKDFHESNGHVKVTPADDLELYQWMQSLRYNYRHQALNTTTIESSNGKSRRRPRLAKEKLATLNQLGFVWKQQSTPDPPEVSWKKRYQELRAFRKKHGHCYVPSLENKPLQDFANKQRNEFRKFHAGNATTMTSEQIKLLNEIHFEWVKPRDRSWEDRRAELEDFWQRMGNSSVPQDYKSNFQLGQWCMNQRSNYRINQKGESTTGLTSERIRKLEKLEFKWSYRRLRWNAMFQRLKRYREEHGHLEISTQDTGNGDLRQWLNEQRFFYREGRTTRMTPERKAMLETIPDFSWERKRATGPSKSEWDQLFVAIREKGITPGGKTKEHWFDGVNRFEQEVKTEWSEQELLALWNEENEDDDDEDGDEYYEDEQSTLFLRA